MSIALAVVLVWPDPAKPRKVTWEDLLLPLVTGAEITRGYTLSPPRRGTERDVVFTARRDDPTLGPPARIEVHIVDKGHWPGIRETKSFGVAYETPRSQAPPEDLEAVTEAIANHLRSNDTGYRGVTSLPLAADPPAPWMARTLEKARGIRGALALLGVCLALGFVSSQARYGDATAAGLLFALGLLFRLPHLDIPFTHDQDVQRFFTGQAPLLEILTGKGLDDRHPPLWFVVLHGVGLFGQTETIARLPAVISGALIAPALLWATRQVRETAGLSAMFAGVVVAISPELLQYSREVSEIPFFSVLIICAVGLVARLSKPTAPTSARRALTVVIALLAWTYYVAPLVVLGLVVALGVQRKLRKDVLVSLGWGIAAGAPAYLLGAWTIVRDHHARQVAAQFPTLAWGQRTPLEILIEMWRHASASVGEPILVLGAISGLLALRSRREPAAFVALIVAVMSAVGIAFASSIARVQAYYVVTLVPLFPLAVALGPSVQTVRSRVWLLASAVCLLWFAKVSRPGSEFPYLQDGEAFMPRFASFVLQRSEKRIVLVAHYDATLLTYYLERFSGGRATWPQAEESGWFVLPTSQRLLLPLAQAHGLTDSSGETLRMKLQEELEQEPLLVIERDTFVLAPVHEELQRCDILLTAPSARLLRCSARSQR